MAFDIICVVVIVAVVVVVGHESYLGVNIMVPTIFYRFQIQPTN